MASVTHMGVPPGDHVVLYGLRHVAGGCAQAGYEFFQVNAGGLGTTPDPAGPPFRIPRGRFLVVTDVEWDYIHPQGASAAGTRHELVLRVQHLGVPTQVMSVFKSATVLNVAGKGGAHVSMTSGFVAAPGTRLCPIVFPGPTDDPGGTSAGLQEVIVRGYLVSRPR